MLQYTDKKLISFFKVSVICVLSSNVISSAFILFSLEYKVGVTILKKFYRYNILSANAYRTRLNSCSALQTIIASAGQPCVQIAVHSHNLKGNRLSVVWYQRKMGLGTEIWKTVIKSYQKKPENQNWYFLNP